MSMGDAHSPTRLSRPPWGRFASAKQKVRTNMDSLINKAIYDIIRLINEKKRYTDKRIETEW